VALGLSGTPERLHWLALSVCNHRAGYNVADSQRAPLIGDVFITSSWSSSSSGTKPLPPHVGHCCSSSVPFSMTPSPLQSGQVFICASMGKLPHAYGGSLIRWYFADPILAAKACVRDGSFSTVCPCLRDVCYALVSDCSACAWAANAKSSPSNRFAPAGACRGTARHHSRHLLHAASKIRRGAEVSGAVAHTLPATRSSCCNDAA
jgi:hypothetical protein